MWKFYSQSSDSIKTGRSDDKGNSKILASFPFIAKGRLFAQKFYVHVSLSHRQEQLLFVPSFRIYHWF